MRLNCHWCSILAPGCRSILHKIGKLAISGLQGIGLPNCDLGHHRDGWASISAAPSRESLHRVFARSLLSNRRHTADHRSGPERHRTMKEAAPFAGGAILGNLRRKTGQQEPWRPDGIAEDLTNRNAAPVALWPAPRAASSQARTIQPSHEIRPKQATRRGQSLEKEHRVKSVPIRMLPRASSLRRGRSPFVELGLLNP